MRILPTKKILVSGLAALSLVLSGCLTDSSVDGAPKITTQPMTQTIALGDTLHLSVVATGDATLHYSWIATYGGVADTLAGDGPTLTKVLGIRQDGASIVCVVSNTKGTTVSSPAIITVTGTPWPTATALTLGAQGNLTLGSVLDLDSGKVWSTTTANANQSKIDLVYLYYKPTNSTDSIAVLAGARAARDTGVKYSINLTNTYDTLQVKNIMLVEVSAKPASRLHAAIVYNDGAKVTSAVISMGKKYIVKTTAQNFAYVEVTAIVSGKTGTSAVSISTSNL